MIGDQLIVSKELKNMFPAYLNSVELFTYEPRNEKDVGLAPAPGRDKKGDALKLIANG